MKKSLEDTVRRVLDKEVGFLIDKDKERLAKAIAEAISKKFYSVSFN